MDALLTCGPGEHRHSNSTGNGTASDTWDAPGSAGPGEMGALGCGGTLEYAHNMTPVCTRAEGTT